MPRTRLGELEDDAGYVDVLKERLHGQRTTRIRLSPQGRQAFEAHAAALQQIVATANRRPTNTTPPT